MNSDGIPPSVPPRLEPSVLKKPLGRAAFARTPNSWEGMPRVRPYKFVSMP
jgi:hypothetical protein